MERPITKTGLTKEQLSAVRSKAGKKGALAFHVKRGFSGMPYLKVLEITKKGGAASAKVRAAKALQKKMDSTDL